MDPLGESIFLKIILVSMLRDTWKIPLTLWVKNFGYSPNVTGYVEISMDHLLGKNIFELVSMLEGTWKFLCTLSVKNFLN